MSESEDRSTPESEEPGHSGFILVGVIMFMLTLTILGLSLFALSSYEGQFFFDSQSREQALQNAESGIHLVQALLAQSGSLPDAQKALGQFGVTRALAWQSLSSNANDTTSRAPVNWDSTVVIAVTARAGSVERTIESRFVPISAKSPYRQLITCGLGLTVTPNGGSQPALEFTGPVWQPVRTATDADWTHRVLWPAGGPIDATVPPSLPANAFVDAGLVTARNPDGASSTYSIRYQNSPGIANAHTYLSPHSPTSGSARPEYGSYSYFCDAPLTVSIRGVVIWVVDGGACFDDLVTIKLDNSGDPSTLILVAKPNGHDPGHENRGLWFQGGLSIPDPAMTHVYLVSEGDISIDQIENPTASLQASALTIAAGGDVELMGPAPATVSHLAHAVAMDAESDQLLALGFLPPAGGATGHLFALAAHSWKETSPP